MDQLITVRKARCHDVLEQFCHASPEPDPNRLN
jgi:hypothetical protein